MNIIICDDHVIVADGIAMLFGRYSANLRVAHYQTARSLLDAAELWSDVELILLDLILPDLDGFVTLQQLRQIRDDIPVVILSGLADRTSVMRAIDLGAMGFIPKTSSTSTMIDALRIVMEGGVYLPRSN